MSTAMGGDRSNGGLPVAIIGAGPVGLAAAAHGVARGETPLVLEAGDAVGASMREWGHVRVFSPWKYLVDATAEGLLRAAGWERPDPEALPTGDELVRQLLDPLAGLPSIAPHVRLGRRVVAVSRRGLDKLKTSGREAAPFELVVQTDAGVEERYLARAVVDASGTWTQRNPLGANGLAVAGERESADRIVYGIPDVLGRDRARYAGKRVLVVGSGHSAFNALLDLAELRRESGAGAITWAVRRRDVRQLYGGKAKDALPARGALGDRLHTLIEREEVQLVTGFRTARVDSGRDALYVQAENGAVIGPFDEIIVATGFRPNLELTRELRVRLDEALESPVALAPLIDPNVHSCGTVYPHGYEELSHPEPGYFTVGMKSYGRAPTFLLLTGYEQVRSVMAAISGDMEAARSVELVLPETGVCSTDIGGSACCTTQDSTPELVSLGVTSKAPVGGSCGIGSGCSSPASELVGAGSGGGCCG